MLETQETWVLSLGGKDPWRRKWQPTPVFLLGKSHGQRSLTRCSPRGPKDLDMTERLNTQSLAIYVLKANSVFTSAFQWKLVVTLQTLIVKRTWVNLCFIYGNHSFEILSDAGRLNILQCLWSSLWHLEDYASKKNKEKDFVSNEGVYTQKNIKEN